MIKLKNMHNKTKTPMVTVEALKKGIKNNIQLQTEIIQAIKCANGVIGT